MNASATADSDKRDRQRKIWIAVAVLAVLLALAFGLWWWLQAREADRNAEQRARLQAALERQRALTDELAKVVPAAPADCPPGQTAVPNSETRAAAPAASAALPPLPTAGDAAPLGGAKLAEHLERATAIVLVAGENDLGTGTGFFVAPNLLVTNRHVVEQAAGRHLLLTSKALGSLRRAAVLRVTQSSDPGSPDFALLRMEQGSAPGTLDMTSDIGKLDSVVAAGYPGVVLQNDASFARLMRGDLSAAPDLNLTQGTVQSLQSGTGGMPLIVHTASIAKGNSGGPLVDGCGRVVGVNTFINVDQSQSAKTHYAIRSQAMASFLSAAGASARSDGRRCKG